MAEQKWNSTWKRGLGETHQFAKRAAKRLRPHSRILDLGCGTGKDAIYFAKKGHTVIAVDFSVNALEWLAKTATQKQLPLKTLRKDIAKKLPFPDKTFDAVYAHLSLHYFDTKHTARIFAEIHRILKKGGLSFVKCKSVDDPLYGKGKKRGEDMYEHGHLRHFFSKTFLLEMLSSFVILDIRKSSGVDSPGRLSSAFVEAVAQKA